MAVVLLTMRALLSLLLMHGLLVMLPARARASDVQTRAVCAVYELRVHSLRCVLVAAVRLTRRR